MNIGKEKDIVIVVPNSKPIHKPVPVPEKETVRV